MTFIRGMEAECSLIMFSDWSQTVPFAKLNSIEETKCVLCEVLAPEEDRRIQFNNSFPVPTRQLVSLLAKCLNITSSLHVSLLHYSHARSHTKCIAPITSSDGVFQRIYCYSGRALLQVRTPLQKARYKWTLQKHTWPERTYSLQPRIQAVISQVRKWTNRTRWRE